MKKPAMAGLEGTASPVVSVNTLFGSDLEVAFTTMPLSGVSPESIIPLAMASQYTLPLVCQAHAGGVVPSKKAMLARSFVVRVIGRRFSRGRECRVKQNQRVVRGGPR